MLTRIASLGLALCVSAGAVAAQQNLTAEATSPGGPPFTSITHLAEVASAAGIANLQVQSGQTLTNSVLNVAQGKTEISTAPLVLVFLLSKGLGPYSKQGNEGADLAANLRALYPYNLGGYTMYAFESSNVGGWDDLKNRVIYNGPPAGGALVGARQMLQLVGGVKESEDYRGIQVNWGQSEKTISDGSAELFVLPESHPSQRITSAQASGRVVIYSVPKGAFESEAFTRWATSPGNAPVTVAGANLGYGDDVTLKSEDNIWRGVNITAAEIVHKDMDSALVQALVTEYIKSMDQLVAKAPFVKNMGIGVIDAQASGFCGPNPLKYHPGAIAAWEAAGYTIPDCAKP